MGCPFRFGCHAGELRSGLSGWKNGKAEVLELLTFWKRGTAGGPWFSNLAFSPKRLMEANFNKICLACKNML